MVRLRTTTGKPQQSTVLVAAAVTVAVRPFSCPWLSASVAFAVSGMACGWPPGSSLDVYLMYLMAIVRAVVMAAPITSAQATARSEGLEPPTF
jgi:hypothetical protein